MMLPYMSVKVRETTTPRTTCPTLYEEEENPTDLLHVQGLVRRGLQFIVLIREDYMRKSNRLQMLLKRQQFLLSYLKTLSLGPAGV